MFPRPYFQYSFFSSGHPKLTKAGLDAALDFAARQFQGEEVRMFSWRK